MRAYDDPRIIFNMSVWESVEALKEYVYRGMHGEIFARRQDWFEKMEPPYMAMWWIPAGSIPEIADAKKRLDYLLRHEESPYAFTFRKILAPRPNAPDTSDSVTSPSVVAILTKVASMQTSRSSLPKHHYNLGAVDIHFPSKTVHEEL